MGTPRRSDGDPTEMTQPTDSGYPSPTGNERRKAQSQTLPQQTTRLAAAAALTRPEPVTDPPGPISSLPARAAFLRRRG